MPFLVPSLISSRTRVLTPGRIGLSLALLLTTVSCAALPTSESGGSSTPAPAYPTHVHGLVVKPGTQEVLVASHEGLFGVHGADVQPVGANIDLMGFTITGGGKYLASGHPGSGVDLPNPVGLIRSSNGQTWEQVALGGESDFHTLTAVKDGIIGFDGSLKISPNGGQWTDATTQISPYNLAGNPASEVAVATTEDGIYRSLDAGRTWTKEAGAPVVLVAAVTSESTIIGVLPTGAVMKSSDEGLTWAEVGKVSGQPSAVAAAETPEGMDVWVTTESGLEQSVDGGKTFTITVPVTK